MYALCEIETAHPGYLGSQDTFYVVILKRGWQEFTSRPLLILYSKSSLMQKLLHKPKRPLRPQDILNEQSIAYFETQDDLPMLRHPKRIVKPNIAGRVEAHIISFILRSKRTLMHKPK